MVTLTPEQLSGLSPAGQELYREQRYYREVLRPQFDNAVANEQFLRENVERSTFDMHAMARGLVSTRSSHFYDWNNAAQGTESLMESMGASFARLEEGMRIPMNKLTRNPMLAVPSVTAMRFFGQSPVIKVAMDQIIPKRIGVFNAEIGGVASASFNISANPSLSVEVTVPDFVQKMLFGAKEISQCHPFFAPLQAAIQQVQNVIGADGKVKISLALPNEFAKLLQGLATVISQGKQLLNGIVNLVNQGQQLINDATNLINKGAEMLANFSLSPKSICEALNMISEGERLVEKGQKLLNRGALFNPTTFSDGVAFSIDVQSHIRRNYGSAEDAAKELRQQQKDHVAISDQLRRDVAAEPTRI